MYIEMSVLTNRRRTSADKTVDTHTLTRAKLSQEMLTFMHPAPANLHRTMHHPQPVTLLLVPSELVLMLRATRVHPYYEWNYKVIGLSEFYYSLQ